MPDNSMNLKLDISPAFFDKMKRLLGDEFAEFEQSYAQDERVGLRVNTLKITPADFTKLAPFALTPVGEYESAGFLVQKEMRDWRLEGSSISSPQSLISRSPGSHPYHAAGLYYLQEPAAMTVAALLNPQPGELVLDLSAAPGGKTTHLASLMQDEGLLVANDVDTKRAWLLAENLERWGTRNALILNDTPERIAATFGPVFDKVLVDAPCSGEGMFRKKGGFEWSGNMVAACARRQNGILQSAAALVKAGGQLIYSTCTFSPEENEQVIGRFLTTHPDFELVELPHFAGFGRGRPEWGALEHGITRVNTDLAKTVRLWPHKFPGEGHFIALLQKAETAETAVPRPFRPTKPPNLQPWHTFASHSSLLTLRPSLFTEVNGRFYALPPLALDTGSLHILRYGLLLGEPGKGYFKPAHTLALALKPAEMPETVNFTADSAEIRIYLNGQDLPSPGADGWKVVTVDGFPIGWGKQVNGRLKNHYPRGLRQNFYGQNF